ncbi:nicotinate-nucleotide adenylyltransferase [Thalassotalea euphylliae]|uniref:Probable nicotinate-nucleotide adenylyltransferase n=1 Tax=Thalassotalea euphylliae TaxID=1655234 RepID=A0A3E0TQF2_9GAMM|nr:nicotinate-nucleotide adenylyltransferase [Thalassotalea euphylliae]REL26185.1 nicotinate-nucleotide adenylyltransferase [Thalassotalea euphylliae]
MTKLALENNVSQLIFGGTFDPFHLGHLTLCKHIASDLGVTQITLLPANIPPHKAAAQVSSEHRLAMLRALVNNETLFSLDDRELHRDKPSYTVDTLQEMYAQSPNQAISLIIGMDSLLSFTRWHRWQEIISQVNLIVCTRPHYVLDKQQLVAELQQRITVKSALNLHSVGQIYLAPPHNTDVSSTSIRALLSGADQASHALSDGMHGNTSPNKAYALLPEKIADYIAQHQLYRS